MTLFEMIEQAHDAYEVLGDEGDVVIEIYGTRFKIMNMRVDYDLAVTVLDAEEL